MLQEHISKRSRALPDSDFVRILKMAAEGKGIISLGPGEPDFGTPDHIVDAAKKSLDEGKTHYSPMAGRSELRQAISNKLKKDNQVDAGPEDVIVTCGSTESIILACMALLDAGEEVLVPDPCFLAYQPTVELFNCYPVSVRLEEEQEFQLTAEALEKAIKDPNKVRALLLCNPSNPTGAVLKRKEMEEVAGVCVEHDIILLSDEAYEKLVYGNAKHISFASLNGMGDHTITFQTFSKSYAMCGFRLGYAAGPAPIISKMTRLHTYTSVSAPTTSQIAGVAALEGPQEPVERMCKEYDRRRKLILGRLAEVPGFHATEPHGAFYAFPSIHFSRKGKALTSNEMTEFLIKEAKVLAVPGTEFGRYGEGFMRLSYATAYEKVEEAMDRVEQATKKLVSQTPR